MRLAMTRAITIEASAERVWPWIALLGHGAGWYSVDRFDNRGRASAWHLVSWVFEPSVGDTTGIGYLRHGDSGRSLAWWLDGGRFIGISADTAGPLAPLAMVVFEGIDSLMACRPLIGLRDRAGRCTKGEERWRRGKLATFLATRQRSRASRSFSSALPRSCKTLCRQTPSSSPMSSKVLPSA